MANKNIKEVEGGEVTVIGKDDGLELDTGAASPWVKWSTINKLLSTSGQMLNGKINVTVSGNNLTLALKTYAGSDPSASDPIFININGTIREVTTATNITLAAATNWFNAGGAELATKEVDYFAYTIWDSNSSVVAIAPARIPYGRLVSDFNSTNTNERFLGNYSNYTSTDDVCVIGRFAATLSAGAGYTWTVPTYTNSNLIQHPIYETRRLSYVPTPGGFSGTPTFDAALYKIINRECRIDIDNYSGTSNATNFSLTAPISTSPDSTVQGVGGFMTDNSAALTTACRIAMSASSNSILLRKDMANGVWTGSGTKGAYFQLRYFIG